MKSASEGRVNWDTGSKQPNETFHWATAIPNAIETILEDGHVPETLSLQKQVLRIYPEYHTNRPALVHVIDDAVPDEFVNRLYDYTIEYCCSSEPKGPAWGSYVTIEEIRELWKTQESMTSISSSECFNSDCTQFQQQDLALHAASYFFRNAMKRSDSNNEECVQSLMSTINVPYDYQQNGENEDINDNSHQKNNNDLWSLSDMSNPLVHGIAIWALASDVGASVPYHIDYAELIRYEYGYLIPPVLAGTLHCTPYHVSGGDYCVNMNGLDHYSKYGYKGLLQSKNKSCNTTGTSDDNNKSNKYRSNIVSHDEIMKNDTSWMRIPFQYNRMICQSGHLPHLSTPVESITTTMRDGSFGNKDIPPMSSTTHHKSILRRRVIVGFNVFLRDIGPLIQHAPEHSDAFRERVSQLRKERQQTAASRNSNNNRNKFSIDKIKSNPRLASFLVLAKREIVKQNLKMAQSKLDNDIQNYIQSLGIVGTTTTKDDNGNDIMCETYENEIVNRFSRTDGEWPNRIDVQVHFQNRFVKKKKNIRTEST